MKMDNLLLNPITSDHLSGMIAGSHHAIALVGATGTGKGHIAKYIAEASVKGDTQYDSVKIIVPDNGMIGIDEIRDIKRWLRLKLAGTERIKRVLIIEDAQHMTLESQNALLKILEEPPADTRIILTLDNNANVKPTILSRVQILIVRPVQEEQVLKHFLDMGFSKEKINRAFLISKGKIGLCYNLLYDDPSNISKSLEDAKSILSADVYSRLLNINELIKDKNDVNRLIVAIKCILTTAIDQLASNEKDNNRNKKINSNIMRLREVYQAEGMLNSNANAKLVLTNLLINI